MTVTLGGPMFMPAKDTFRESVFRKEGAHYNIYASCDHDAALQMLRDWFGDKNQINEMNFVLFSTSGIHGMYTTIEEVEADIKEFGDDIGSDEDDRPGRYVTFLLVQPRIVGMTYGNCACKTLDDVKFLKTLRRRSWAAVAKIGADK